MSLGLRVYLHGKSGQFLLSKALRLPPQCRPPLSSPTNQPNWLTLENTEYKREVFLEIPSRTPNAKSNDKNSEKGRKNILITNTNEWNRTLVGGPTGPARGDSHDQHNRGSLFRYSFSKLSLQANPGKLVIYAGKNRGTLIGCSIQKKSFIPTFSSLLPTIRLR